MIYKSLISLAQWRIDASRRLTAQGVACADTDARVLLQHVTTLSREALLMHANTLLSPDVLATLNGLLDRRLALEPIAYLVGHAHFYEQVFSVGPGALIPRSDSECLIDLARALCPNPKRILDFGVGPGTLLLTLLLLASDATGVGVDQSDAALVYARANAAQFGVQPRVSWVQDSWEHWCSETPFDLIVSNPPYIEHGDIAGLQVDVRGFEPHSALDGGPDGLVYYRALAPKIAAVLAEGGISVIEVGAGQARDVQILFEGAGLDFIKSAADLSGIERALAFKKPHQ